ncbi:acetylornithine transaminase [Psychrobacillus lasiicapitis]|uniref:Acetylornithine aminotransferase n=1 Tax=Psychrobacillus lasiicapitis TaxID=1636719 RepID=A0A544TBS6_9BACI|nr:acetylornithine transaminase [Psychrobacillus lasiicapitis]TQR14910.1 acetylornithine transaminase [Psychrobacillus lasiicapitis]GGA20978.1 acetylornithine aminotransferase [Psychrobacillus lasiicapitis]
MSALFQNYARRPVHLVQGKGTIVTDDTGKEYLDFTSGIAVLSLGHANPAVVQAIQQQSEKLWHTSNLFESPEQEKLAATLVKETHLSHAFFCNSGAEANEAAIKMARKHTGKNIIITFEKSFHGRTFGAMSATGQDKIRQGFGPLLETFRTIPFNDIQALDAAIDSDVAAIMLEVIQGEGGINKISPEFAQAVADICESKDILLIIDEVQTGIARTGTRYAYEQTVLKPDIMTLAKGLGGGFPIGAMLGTSALYDTFSPGTHGTTFGGNPLAVAVAQTVLDNVFTTKFLNAVNEKSAYFLDKLKTALPNHQIVGSGLLLGIKCEEEVAPTIEKAEQNGLLLVSAGPNVIRLLPPLTVKKEEIDQAVNILSSILM